VIRSAALTALAVAVCVSLSGCGASAPPPASGAPQNAMSSAQKSSLKDGQISHDEYEAGYRRYVACLSKKGYSVINNGEKNDVIDYAVPSAAVDSGADDFCYQREFEQIDNQWQVAHQDTSDTAVLARSCLQAHGVTPKDKLNDMLAQLKAIGITIDQCLAS